MSSIASVLPQDQNQQELVFKDHIFPSFATSSPFFPRIPKNCFFQNDLFDLLCLYPDIRILHLSQKEPKRKRNEKLFKLGFLLGTPKNKDRWKDPGKEDPWTKMRDALLKFYNEVFQGEYEVVKDLILKDGEVDRDPQNIPNHFIMYEGDASNASIIAAVSFGCTYDICARDEYGQPRATRALIHYIAVTQKLFQGGDKKPFLRRGIGSFMLGLVDWYVRYPKPNLFLPFSLVVNTFSGDNDGKAVAMFSNHGYTKSKLKNDVMTEVKDLFYSVKRCSATVKKRQVLMESRVPAWLCRPPQKQPIEAPSPPPS
jgi:hypothetical protein